MRNILLVNINQHLIDLYSLNLSTFTGAEIIVKETGAQAIKYLEQDPNISLVICRTRIGQEATLDKVMSFIREKKLNTHVIALGKIDDTTITSLEDYDDIEGLIKGSASLLEVSAQDMASVVTENYYPIPISHFYALKKSFCGVFIKIGSGITTKFLKRIHAEENLDDKCLHRYITSGVEYLYVESSNRLQFVTQLTSEILKDLDSNDLTEGEAFNARRISQELVAQNIRQLGINDQIIQLSNSAIDSMLKDVQVASPKLKNIIKIYYSRKEGYIYKRTQLTTYIGLQMLKATDWAKAPQFQTFSFVAFFHDISLADEKLARIHSDQELAVADLNEDEKELVLEHAQKSEALTIEFPHAPLGADAIIRQHHATLNGIGFTETYTGNISPLAIIFVIAEDCADYILKRKFEEVKGYQVLEYLRSKYQSPRFIKIIRSLNSVF